MDSRIPKPGRIVAARKENLTRSNTLKLTTATVLNSLHLTKEVNRPLTTRSKTVTDIKPALTNANVGRAVVAKKPVGRLGAATGAVPKIIVTKQQPANNPPVQGRKAPLAVTKSDPAANKAKPAAKRIPPYDYKARFLDLTEKHKVLKDKHDSLREQLTHFDDLPDLYEQCKTELAQTTVELSEVRAELEAFKTENKDLKGKNSALVETIHELKAKLAHYEVYCPQLESQLKCAEDNFAKTREENAVIKEKNANLEKELGLCAEQLFETNIERKNLHNEVMDLRGNIRVFCRVRPPLHMETTKRLCQWNYLDECSLEIYNADEKSKVNRHDFAFDHVFHPNSTQLDIFENVTPLIQSALDGYNVCIFAYGQTGSGKTFTMDGLAENIGVIPRTVDLLFKSVRDYRRLGWEYEIRAQFLEIYNEVLYDLLSNEDKKLDICMVSPNNKTEVYVSNLTEAVVETENDLRQLIHVAKVNRMTACTANNERSSRSHAVTKITLIGTHAGKQERCVGNINLVDLAGSESPKNSTRMDETKSINKSLSELSNVILALVQRNEHVPYRNSKLTHLLMPSLGGNSKTLMFVNVAPFTDCHAETIKSLRFAATVNSCKMAKVKKNRVLNTTS